MLNTASLETNKYFKPQASKFSTTYNNEELATLLSTINENSSLVLNISDAISNSNNTKGLSITKNNIVNTTTLLEIDIDNDFHAEQLILNYDTNNINVKLNINKNITLIENFKIDPIVLSNTINIFEQITAKHIVIAHNNNYLSYNGIFNIHTNSTLTSNIITLSTNAAQFIYSVNLNNKNSNFIANNINIQNADNKSDIIFDIKHHASNTNSHTDVRSFATDLSIISTLGKITVYPNASTTCANLQIKNLLGSRGATCNSRPQLEIYHDDVVCSHGATNGAIDQEFLYYLQSRGISKKDATMIIIDAFLHSAIEKINCESLSNFIHKHINSMQIL